MGGTNEKVLSGASTGTSGGKSVSIGSSSVRIHENAGQVHLHDDAKGIKVEIPVAEFMKLFGAWKDSPIQPLVLIDHAKKTQATIAMSYISGEMDVDVQISKAKFGKNLQALLDFSEGK